MRTPQRPLPSGFGHASTADEVLTGRNLLGRVAIVTGGGAGLGREAVRALSRAGATVIAAVRNPALALAALEGLPRVTVEALDLEHAESIDAFARRIIASGQAVHLLLNNAGVMAAPLRRTAKGHEVQFAVNHLGHFRLTAGLWPALKQAGGARVVSMSSGAHRASPVDFDDPHFERRPYDKWKAYGQSKTANALFALGLDMRAAAHGVRAFSSHPGSIFTDLSRHLSEAELNAMRKPDANGQPTTAVYKTVAQGAATGVWCLTSAQLDGMGGVYCEDCDIAQGVDADKKLPGGVRPWASDPTAADRLWRLSEQLTGVNFALSS
ncbi:MAG: oxidoreductase [Sulfuricaulis sp.]|nr:oxidoreductase [Sulfuricaulis sp.]